MENVKYDQGAKKELREAAEWYNSQTPGKGEEFLQEVERAVVQLLRSPTRWRMVRPPYRRVLVKRFPYGIIYRVDGQEVFIAAVMHLKRHPDYWIDRVNDID